MIWKHRDSIQKLNNNNKKSKNIQFLKSSENISVLLLTWGSEIVFNFGLHFTFAHEIYY